MTEGKYPHWKDALLGNGTVANLRCAVKYGFWHLAYGLLFVLGVILLAGAWLLDKTTGSSAVGRVQSGLGHPRVKQAGRVLGYGFLALYAVFIVAVVVKAIIEDPMLLVWAVGVCVAFIVAAVRAILAWEYGGDKAKTTVHVAKGAASRAGERAVETRGVRRVYVNCPVHMDIEPKWFERITEAFD